MQRILFLFMLGFFLFSPAAGANELKTVIIEVEGDVGEHLEYIETYHPFITVIATYSTVFNGIALEGKPEHFSKIEGDHFVKAVHEVQTYKADPLPSAPNTAASTQDSEKMQTRYSGKGIKVAVIDTGIDYTHPDLKKNYQKGYDVYDFDADPMETRPEEGIPTNHGTHVAGIIAADGEMQGVAPGADIYAYRALGPGGVGSTVHVLAALEQAVTDGVDVINLSLGNQVNGPDYPTSTAVNRTVALGIPVIIANGNSGPGDWTVGAPATAEKALSVGAAALPGKTPSLYDRFQDKEIPFQNMIGAPPWELPNRDYQLVNGDNPAAPLQGKIAIYKREDIPFREIALEAQKRGAEAVLIYNNEPGIFQGGIENEDGAVTIPAAGISAQDGEWLREYEGTYLETVYEETDTAVASFSSRGPVTVNWQMKPDILAPGTAVNSTVPGGYAHFDGTSMAAPYVSGVVALMKEAQPDWPLEKIYQAIKTTALPLKEDSSELIAPHIQGYGHIRPAEAIHADTIIYDSALQLGKINGSEPAGAVITIENLSQQEKQFTFRQPRQEKGLRWKLPAAFTVPPKEKKEVEITGHFNHRKLADGIHGGYLELIEKAANTTYHLPYLFVKGAPGQPKTYGFEFDFKLFSEDTYRYSYYATEALQSFTVDLYDPDTLTYRGRIIAEEESSTGLNEGELQRKSLTPGIYHALITAKTAEGITEQEETYILIE